MSDIFNGYMNNQIIEPVYQYEGKMSNVNIDNALTAVLNKFDDNYIMDTILYSIKNRFRLYDQSMPNIIYGYEQEFIEITQGFSSNQDDIADKRLNTYANIIQTLCDTHNIVFNNSDNVDMYSAASFLYKFLVAEFTGNIITFFTNFLIRERSGIYNSVRGQIELKKNDGSMVYSNKLFKSEKMSFIHANIGYVLNDISEYDIDLYTILDLIYSDKNISRYIFSLVTDNGTFFKSFFVPYIMDAVTGSELQTMIKLNLQTCASELMEIDTREV